jgi:4-hydroxybenzoate polyprenyltransferase
MSIYSKILPYIHLGRFHKPIGTSLVYLPFTWGCALTYTHPPLLLAHLSLYYLSSVTLRAAACAINDYWDKDIDPHYPRTSYRPLAQNQLSFNQALSFCVANTCIGLGALYATGPERVLFGLTCAPLVIGYPLAKRYTHFP